jgi:hypothetical protein
MGVLGLNPGIVIDHDEKRSSFFVQRIDVAALVQFLTKLKSAKRFYHSALLLCR